MKKCVFAASCLALGAMMTVGCSKDAEPAKDEVVLSVGDKTLTRAQVNDDVAKLIAAQGDKIPADQQEYAKQMIQNQLVQAFLVENALVARATVEGYVVTDEDRKAREDEFMAANANRPDAPKSLAEFMEKFPLGKDRAQAEFEHGILIDKMLKDATAKNPVDVTAEAEQILARIEADKAKNAATPEEAEKKINELKAQLDATPADQLAAKFAELAAANSACPSSQKGGDLGTFQRGQMVKEFDEAAFTLPLNTVSAPVKTQFGYHLIMVTEKNPAVEATDDKPATPETVRASHILIKAAEADEKTPSIDEIKGYLQKQAERKAVQDFIMDTMKHTKIEAPAEDFKQYLPPADEPEEAPAAAEEAK